MKKNGIFAILLICGSGALFSFEESWTRFGFEFGNYIEHSVDGTSYTGAPGFNIGIYGFSDNQNIGIFLHYGMLFPVISDEDWDIGFMQDIIIGPGFRYSFSDAFKLHFGAGVDWLIGGSSYEKDSITYRKTVTNLGIAGDVGVKFDITDFFYVNAGLTLSCFFLGFEGRSVSERIDNKTFRETQLSDRRIEEFVGFGIKPYLCVGINAYSEKSKWGKPPKKS
jgi:hypothetical protein